MLIEYFTDGSKRKSEVLVNNIKWFPHPILIISTDLIRFCANLTQYKFTNGSKRKPEVLVK